MEKGLYKFQLLYIHTETYKKKHITVKFKFLPINKTLSRKLFSEAAASVSTWLIVRTNRTSPQLG